MNKYKTSALIERAPLLDTLISTTKEGKKRPSIRLLRWICIIFVNFIFFLSYNIDLQLLEGTLTGSRLFGFHLIDPFISLQMFLAHYSLHINLVIGTLTIILFYLFVGGRAFCSWICPYGLLGEIAEKLHYALIRKNIIKSHSFDYRIKYVFWVFFLFLALFAGFLAYEMINPMGILSRAIVYGWSLALIVPFAFLLAEVLFSHRFWCKYVCPNGVTYSLIGWFGATKIKWTSRCDHCGVCSNVCIVPHVLDTAKKSDKDEKSIISGDCTLCGRCIDVCHKDALSYETKLKKLI